MSKTKDDSAFITYVKSLSLGELTVSAAGYLGKGMGIAAEIILFTKLAENPNTPPERVLAIAGVGALSYLIGYGIHARQDNIKTYKKLDNIEKLLIEQKEK